jgi:hypothetical protein
MPALEKDCVLINAEPDEDGVWGVLNIKRGLKRQARARKVRINTEMKEVLERLMGLSQCRYVITDPGSGKKASQTRQTPASPASLGSRRPNAYVLR